MFDAMFPSEGGELIERRHRFRAAHSSSLRRPAARPAVIEAIHQRAPMFATASGGAVAGRRDHAGLGEQANGALGRQVEHDASGFTTKHMGDDAAAARSGVLHHTFRTRDHHATNCDQGV